MDKRHQLKRCIENYYLKEWESTIENIDDKNIIIKTGDSLRMLFSIDELSSFSSPRSIEINNMLLIVDGDPSCFIEIGQKIRGEITRKTPNSVKTVLLYFLAQDNEGIFDIQNLKELPIR